ncbi:MAG: nucleotidyltransferase domain-containing protein [Candidatus Omnitrophica bacterium]|nr:nucleotidyltransferase domain-containing protein [Candidatus Omnitrophota bacterium]
MKKNNKEINIFQATNSLKVLSYLAQHPGKEFLNSEIQKATFASRIGVYFALRGLIRRKLVSGVKRGRAIFYTMARDDVVVRQFKILTNVLALRPIISKLKPSSRKIILYGSYSRGENDPLSDIDLFVFSKEPQVTKAAISSVKSKQKIQAVVKTSSEVANFKESEKVFMQEVERGIILWEQKE